MIVNPRGTFGSGKSTIVRKVMERYAERDPAMTPGRKQPYGYTCYRADGGPNLWVVGHYETRCGGADTIDRIDDIYAQVNGAAERGYDVIYEGGALVQSDWRRAAAAAARFPTLIIVLDVPIEMCLEGIRARREARGDTRPLNPKNTIGRARDTLRNAEHLRTNNVAVEKFQDRDLAAVRALGALGWS